MPPPQPRSAALAKYLATTDGPIIEEAYQAYRGIYPKVPYMTEEQSLSILAVTDPQGVL